MRQLVLVCILLLFLTPFSVVYADTESFTINGKTFSADLNTEETSLGSCDGGDAADGERCNINGDLPNPTFRPSTTTHPCHLETDENGDEYIACEGSQTHVRDDTFTWSSQRDAVNYDLTKLKEMLEQARRPLTPQIIWDQTIRFTNPQWDSWIARACDFKQQDSDPPILIRNDLSRERMKLGPDPNIPPVVENLEYFKSTMSTLKRTNQYYQKAIELVKKATAYACNFRRDAIDVITLVKESQGHGIWELLQILFQTKLFDLSAQNTSYKIITETARKPYSEEMASGLIQATEETFADSRASDTRKNTVMANAGIVETFRPCSVQFEGPEKNGELLNEYEWVNGGGTFPMKSRQHLMKLVDEATNFLQSTLLPASRQSEEHKITLQKRTCGAKVFAAPISITSSTTQPVPPGIRSQQNAQDMEITRQDSCEVKKPISSSVSRTRKEAKKALDAAIGAAASWAKIPDCVLEGIADIEGATQEMAQGSCVPNQCGAAGPFQVSVGVDFCGRNNCIDCGPGWADGNGKCNNESWALELAGGTAKDACNVNVAAKAAAAVVMGKANGFKIPFNTGKPGFDPNDAQQQQTIIIASDAYYGVTRPIEREPLNGLSYGEYVYETCLKSVNPNAEYTHQEHSFPPRD